jgi:excinuclease ABC subunit C
VERDRLSADLDFEGAAQLHTKVAKVKGILSLCDDICRRLDMLDALIIQPAVESDSVALFRFRKGELLGPEKIPVERKQVKEEQEAGGEKLAEPLPSQDELLRDALQKLDGQGAKSATQFSEELAILKRWYYRTHKTGEIILAKADGELPMRKLMNAIARVARGEKNTASQAEERQQQPS